jgi:hypothetical protein
MAAHPDKSLKLTGSCSGREAAADIRPVRREVINYYLHRLALGDPSLLRQRQDLFHVQFNG